MSTDHPDAVEGPGELRVQGPNVFKEYINKPEATAVAFDEEGWFRCKLLIFRLMLHSPPSLPLHPLIAACMVAQDVCQ